MKRDIDNMMAELRSVPLDLNLDETLAHAEQLQLRKRRVRRITATIALLLAVAVTILLLLLLRAPATLTPHSPAPPYSASADSPARQQQREVATTPASAYQPGSRYDGRRRMSVDSELEAPRQGLQFLQLSDFRGPLRIDANVLGTIAGTIAPGDRVVSVEDPDGRETCINVTCTGGDTRTIVCTAPAPSPVRVTTLEGDLLYDIDRADESHTDGPYVAVRTRLASSDVLLWYQVDDRLRAIMSAESSSATVDMVVHSWLRPDSTTIAECATGRSAWAAVDVITPAGTKSSVNARWVEQANGKTQIQLRLPSAGTFVLHVRRMNGTHAEILLVVR